MSAWLLAAYPWLKSLHIIAVVSWMAGLLYLPRLFVYHAMAPAGSDQSETFKVMERRLEQAIMRPAVAATVLSGGVLAATPGVVDWREGWIWAKLACVVGLLAFHAFCIAWRGAFAGDRNRHSPRFFRVVNELPTVALIVIVILVVAKPF